MDSKSIYQPGKSAIADFVSIWPDLATDRQLPCFGIIDTNFVKLSREPEPKVIYRLRKTVDVFWFRIQYRPFYELFYASFLGLDPKEIKNVKFKKAKEGPGDIYRAESIDCFYFTDYDEEIAKLRKIENSSETNGCDSTDTSSASNNVRKDGSTSNGRKNKLSDSSLFQLGHSEMMSLMKSALIVPPPPGFWSGALLKGDFLGLSEEPEVDTAYMLPETAKALYLRFEDWPKTEVYYSRLLGFVTNEFRDVEFKKAKMSSEGIFTIEEPVDCFWIRRGGQGDQKRRNGLKPNETESLNDEVSFSPSLRQ